MIVNIQGQVAINGLAPIRYGTPSTKQIRRAETEKRMHGFYREVGGDHCDVLFNGYFHENGQTVLDGVAIHTSIKVRNDDEAVALALQTLEEAISCVGLEVLT